MISKAAYHRIYLLLLITIFISSIYIKFIYVTDIFTEYDDIGVITLFKGFLGSKEIDLNFFLFEKKFILDQKFFSNFENNFLLPAYIFWEWTYTPFQYFFYYLFDFYNQSVEDKIFLIRLPSIIFSILSLICFLVILNKLKFSKTTKLISLCFLAYSYNFNIYANHASPYSAYIFGGFFGLLNLINYYNSKSSKKYILINTLSIYLSYTNIILFLGFIIIEYKKNNLKYFFIELITKYKIFILINILIFLPIILKFLFSHHTLDLLYRANSREENLFWVNELLNSLYPVLKFIIVGFVNEKIFFIFIIVFIIAAIFLKKNISKIHILSLCSSIFIITWIILSTFEFLPFDETRHSLILLPFVLMIFANIFENLFSDKKIILLPIIFFIINSFFSNINILESKKTNFDYNHFEKSKINIFTYGFTLEPFLISNYKGKIYNTDLKSFNNKKNLNSMNDSEIFLVSTMESFSEKLKRNDLFFKKLNNEYSIEIIKEITTDITRSYNNSCCETTGKNNFYLYKLTKK